MFYKTFDEAVAESMSCAEWYHQAYIVLGKEYCAPGYNFRVSTFSKFYEEEDILFLAFDPDWKK